MVLYGILAHEVLHGVEDVVVQELRDQSCVDEMARVPLVCPVNILSIYLCDRLQACRLFAWIRLESQARLALRVQAKYREAFVEKVQMRAVTVHQ